MTHIKQLLRNHRSQIQIGNEDLNTMRKELKKLGFYKMPFEKRERILEEVKKEGRV